MAQMSVQMEQMAASQLNLETKLQEEQEARASISATNLQLEEEKATLARETEEQNRQLFQLSQRIADASEDIVRMEKDILEQTEAKTQVQEELEASRRNLEESQAEVKTIQQQLNTTVGDLEVLRSEMKDETEKHLRHVEEIQASKEKAEVQLEEEVSRRVQLEALKEQLAGRYEDKQEEIENLTHDMEITRTSHLNKEALLTSSNDRIQALTVQMGAVEESHRCEVEKLEAEGRQ